MRRNRVLIAIAATALVAVGATVGMSASAFWVVPGMGVGDGAVSSVTSVALTSGSGDATLYPGGTTVVVTTATNSNPSPVRIESLSLDTSQGTGGFAVDAAHTGCATSTFSFPTQTNGGSGWTIPANGSLAISIPASLAMSTSAANACQGVLVTVYLRAP